MGRVRKRSSAWPNSSHRPLTCEKRADAPAPTLTPTGLKAVATPSPCRYPPRTAIPHQKPFVTPEEYLRLEREAPFAQ
jgi:hypothetical protein